MRSQSLRGPFESRLSKYSSISQPQPIDLQDFEKLLFGGDDPQLPDFEDFQDFLTNNYLKQETLELARLNQERQDLLEFLKGIKERSEELQEQVQSETECLDTLGKDIFDLEAKIEELKQTIARLVAELVRGKKSDIAEAYARQLLARQRDKQTEGEKQHAKDLLGSLDKQMAEGESRLKELKSTRVRLVKSEILTRFVNLHRSSNIKAAFGTSTQKIEFEENDLKTREIDIDQKEAYLFEKKDETQVVAEIQVTDQRINSARNLMNTSLAELQRLKDEFLSAKKEHDKTTDVKDEVSRQLDELHMQIKKKESLLSIYQISDFKRVAVRIDRRFILAGVLLTYIHYHLQQQLL